MVALLLVIVLAAWGFARLWSRVRSADRVVDLRDLRLPGEALFDAADIAELEVRFEEVERDLRDHGA